MQLKNKIFLGISLFMSQLNYASQDQRPPSVNNVAPEIIADVSEKMTKFDEGIYEQSIVYQFDLSTITPEFKAELFAWAQGRERVKKGCKFDEEVTEDYFERAKKYYKSKVALLEQDFHMIRKLYYRYPRICVSDEETKSLKFNITIRIGQPNALDPIVMERVTGGNLVETLETYGLEEIEDCVQRYLETLKQQSANISGFVNKHHETIFDVNAETSLTNGDMKTLGYLGRYKKLYVKEARNWSALFAEFHKNSLPGFLGMIGTVKQDPSFQPFQSTSLDFESNIESFGFEADFDSEEEEEESDNSDSSALSSTDNEEQVRSDGMPKHPRISFRPKRVSANVVML